MVQQLFDPARLLKRAGSNKLNHFYIACLLLKEACSACCPRASARTALEAMPNLPGALRCQTESGKPAALAASLFTQPVHHEASPVMIQTGGCTGGNDSSSTSSSNSNNKDNNNDSNNNSTRINWWSGLWPNKSER